MKTIKLGLYGNDTGANNVLNAVGNAAAFHPDIQVFRVARPNERVMPDEFAMFAGADALVLGISSGDCAGMEACVAAQVLRMNPRLAGKILMIEDFPGNSGWKNQDHVKVGNAVHLGTILPAHVNARERQVYTDVHTLGVPDHWIPSLQHMQEGARLRSEGVLRKTRKGRTDELPLGPDDLVLYLSGFKDPEMEKHVLQQLLSIRTIGQQNVVVQFRAHPGERNRTDLQEAIVARDALLEGQWKIASPEVTDAGSFSHARLIGASDITVAHPGATENFHVAVLRMRMISVMGLVSDADRRASSYDYNQTCWNTHMVATIAELPQAVRDLSHPDLYWAKALRLKQEQNALPFDPATPMQYGDNVIRVVRSLLT